jgi:hypothetical protein
MSQIVFQNQFAPVTTFAMLDRDVTVEAVFADSNPPTVTLEANKIKVYPGWPVTLIWTSTNADSVQLSGIGELPSFNGNILIQPTETITYKIEAIGEDGIAVAQVTIEVIQELRSTIGDYREVLSWVNMLNVVERVPLNSRFQDNGIYLEYEDKNQIIKEVTRQVQKYGQVNTAKKGTYKLIYKCKKPHGRISPIAELTITPNELLINDCFNLTWSSINADVVWLNGIEVEPKGSVEICNKEAGIHSYTLVAENEINFDIKTAEVKISYPLPEIEFTAYPEFIMVGDSSQLSWSTENTTSLEISPQVSHLPLPLNGSAMVSPEETQTYSLTAVGPGGMREAEVMVIVNEFPPPPENHCAWYTDDPDATDFFIYHAVQLECLARIVNGKLPGYSADTFFEKTIHLLSNCDLSSYSNWESVGNLNTVYYFRGNFNGHGHVIFNLKMTASSEAFGFFGCIGLHTGGSSPTGNNRSAGVIENIGFENARLINSNPNNNFGTAIIAGRIAFGEIKNCYSTGIIQAVANVAGIASRLNSATVRNCWSTCQLHSTGNSGGGIVSHIADSSVVSCCVALQDQHNLGAITNLRRVTGRNDGATLTNLKAWENLLPPDGVLNWPSPFGPATQNGESLDAVQIFNDGSFGKCFTEENGWTVKNGKLPGFLGRVLEIPGYIRERKVIAVEDIIINLTETISGTYGRSNDNVIDSVNLSEMINGEYFDPVPKDYIDFKENLKGDYQKINTLTLSETIRGMYSLPVSENILSNLSFQETIDGDYVDPSFPIDEVTDSMGAGENISGTYAEIEIEALTFTEGINGYYGEDNRDKVITSENVRGWYIATPHKETNIITNVGVIEELSGNYNIIESIDFDSLTVEQTAFASISGTVDAILGKTVIAVVTTRTPISTIPSGWNLVSKTDQFLTSSSAVNQILHIFYKTAESTTETFELNDLAIADRIYLTMISLIDTYMLIPKYNVALNDISMPVEIITGNYNLMLWAASSILWGTETIWTFAPSTPFQWLFPTTTQGRQGVFIKRDQSGIVQFSGASNLNGVGFLGIELIKI